MEFLRFGSSIPGTNWGCCAMDIIQNFNHDPDGESSIQLVDGDYGSPITNDKGMIFAGPTYGDIFRQRIRIGTFSGQVMPNHAFLAVLTESQVSYNPGKKWLKILKEEGFEFIRTVDNSVYTGPKLLEDVTHPVSSHKNYLFGLFRNIGNGAVSNPFMPPNEWTDIPSVVPEPNILEEKGKEINRLQQEYQTQRWKDNPPPPFLSEEEVVAAGAPVVLAGLRSVYPQQTKQQREETSKTRGDDLSQMAGDPFSVDEDDFEGEECEAW